MAGSAGWQAVLARAVRAARIGIAQVQPGAGAAPSTASAPAAAVGNGAQIDLHSVPSPYVQPDRTTCGSATLVMARMINHDDYARSVIAPAATERGADVAARFRADVLAMHELTNALRDETGRVQVPWPKSLGTQPWAVARRMSEPGGCGRPGSTYRVRLADPNRIEAHLDEVATAVSAGHCVPVFVGDAFSPRHIALVVDAAASGDGSAGPAAFGCYDPSRGVRVVLAPAELANGSMNLAGWHQFWLSVLPR